jgi:YidC/Oxa1 family membrane protein insertase
VPLPDAATPAAVRQLVSFSAAFDAPPASLRFFVGPKQFEALRKVDPEFTKVINFGMFAILAVPLLGALQWVNGFVGNYGWAIVILTILINVVMWPLRHKSVVSMRRMQELQPQLKAIQDRFSHLKMTDPARQKMNEEVMALYKAKGVNPASGCVPMLLTLPVLFAFYSLLSQAIEIRGAPFAGWITDLSQHDPWYITPLLMGVTMLWQQRLQPGTGDPVQQKVLMFMPVMFTVMFLWAPSGLVIYWFTSNLWAIGQQYFTNWLIGPAKVPAAAGGKR